MNITLSVSDEIVRKVRKIAVDRNTTLTAMVREYLESVAARDAAAREQAVRVLDDSFARLSRPMGPDTDTNWTRQELHETLSERQLLPRYERRSLRWTLV